MGTVNAREGGISSEFVHSSLSLSISCASFRPLSVPPRVGVGVLDGPEGAAHKGGRRGRTWRNRDVEMTAAGGVCERFCRLLAVTFSLFRHPPRGGSADATFPRWGKEMGTANSPDVAAHLRCCCTARRGRRALRACANSPDGLLCFCAAARNAGDGVPYRVCADSP